MAAATDAVDALIEAGLIEDAAADEAAAVIAAAARDVDAAQQQAARAATAASVTPGEIRVLRYLPTAMTFAVLAGKLGISRSAAKERAERAYKKLGVHTRADAVTRARELDLIPK
jgi:DNA-binding NarL/FixJ family response regulator